MSCLSTHQSATTGAMTDIAASSSTGPSGFVGVDRMIPYNDGSYTTQEVQPKHVWDRITSHAPQMQSICSSGNYAMRPYSRRLFQYTACVPSQATWYPKSWQQVPQYVPGMKGVMAGPYGVAPVNPYSN